MSRYETYKPSGIDWIGDVPKHWEVKRLKDVANVTLGKMLQNDDSGADDLKPYLRSFNVQWDRVDLSEVKEMWLSEYEQEQYRLKKYDLVVSEGGEVGRCAIWLDEIEECYIQNSVHKVTCTKRILPYFLLYQFTTAGKAGHFDKIINKVSIGHLTREKLVAVNFVLPPKSEQLTIANYLDEQTQKIDRLIANKKAQAEKLKELRQIEINNAVTKGLNPNAEMPASSEVEMKDSGIEWLGKIPKHWEVKKVKQLLKPEKNAIKTGPFGSDLKFEDLVEQGVKVYNQRSVLDNDWVSGEGYITEEKYKSLETCTIFPGDIVITTRGTIGKASIFPDNAELGILHPCLMRVQINNYRILNDFLKIIINESGYFLEALKLASNATTIDVVYSDNLKEVKIALPPTLEQEEIIAFVVKRTTAIDQLIKNIEAQIEKLQELRKIKIYEAVTGKIKVL